MILWVEASDCNGHMHVVSNRLTKRQFTMDPRVGTYVIFPISITTPCFNQQNHSICPLSPLYKGLSINVDNQRAE